MALLEASGIGKNFEDTKVLKDISLTLEKGEALAIIGSSGSGKTTLLRCLNFLERPDTGVIKVNGETMWDAADPATQRESEIRKKRLHFGLVFQNFNLFPQYTALQNVMLAGELLAKERPDYKANKKAIHAELKAQARELLAQMGLSERANHYPHQLSGGQQQEDHDDHRHPRDALCPRRGRPHPLYGWRRGGGRGPCQRAHRPSQGGAHQTVPGTLFRIKRIRKARSVKASRNGLFVS